MAKNGKTIRREVEGVVKNASDDILDASLRHATQIERFKAGEIRKIVRFLNSEVLPDAIAELRKRLAKITERGFDLGPVTTQRLKDTIVSVNNIISKGMTQLSVAERKTLNAFATEEGAWQKKALDATLKPLDIQTALPSPQQLRAILTSRPFQGKLYSQWWGDLKVVTRKNISRSIQIGMTQGETTAQITRRVLGSASDAFSTGDFARMRRDASTITRTAVQHVNDQARLATYQANEDIIKGEQWLSTLDSKTTDICMSLDGEMFGLAEGPRPPIHMNCRSIRIPILKSWEEMGLPAGKMKKLPTGTRAAFHGQVPAKTTYEGWLRKMNADPETRNIVDEALGRGRAKLWRAKKITVKDLVDQQHRPISLKDLQNGAA